MGDAYTELLVKCKTSPAMKALKGFLAAVTAIAVVLAVLTFNWVVFIVAIVLGVGCYFVSQNVDLEYEYLHLNDELDIDKIMNKSKRKRVATIDLGSVEVVAPLGSHALDRHQQLKVLDFSAKDPNQKPFVMVCKVGDNMTKVVLQMNQKMIKDLKYRMPRKVVEY